MFIILAINNKLKVLKQMNVKLAGQFGVASGNLKYLIRKCNNEEDKKTLLQTQNIIDKIFKKLNK